jgi:hypothetical protein
VREVKTLLQEGEHVPALLRGHVDVEHDHVRPLLARRIEAGVAGTCPFHPEAASASDTLRVE